MQQDWYFLFSALLVVRDFVVGHDTLPECFRFLFVGRFILATSFSGVGF